jgi:hypothetical protein
VAAPGLKAAVERKPSLPLSTIRVSPFLLSLGIISASLQPSQENSAPASRPSTPLQRVKLGSSSRPATPGSRQPAVAHAHTLHPKQAHFRQHLLGISEHFDTCDRLVQIDAEVASMLDKGKSVEVSRKSPQDAS